MRILFVFTFLAIQSFGQTSEIELTISRLFDTMRTPDSLEASLIFHPDARLGTSREIDGEVEYLSESVEKFITLIGTPHEEVWDERISNLVIQENGIIAQAWMDYKFYFNDHFLHCGINAMTLIKTPEGWRILDIVDTRTKLNCHD